MLGCWFRSGCSWSSEKSRPDWTQCDNVCPINNFTTRRHLQLMFPAFTLDDYKPSPKCVFSFSTCVPGQQFCPLFTTQAPKCAGAGTTTGVHQKSGDKFPLCKILERNSEFYVTRKRENDERESNLLSSHAPSRYAIFKCRTLHPQSTHFRPELSAPKTSPQQREILMKNN